MQTLLSESQNTIESVSTRRNITVERNRLVWQFFWCHLHNWIILTKTRGRQVAHLKAGYQTQAAVFDRQPSSSMFT